MNKIRKNQACDAARLLVDQMLWDHCDSPESSSPSRSIALQYLREAIKFQEEVLEDADVSMLRSCYSCISHLCRCLRDGSSIDGMVSVYASMSLPKCDLTDEEKYAREKYANLFEVANSVLCRVLRLNHE